MRTRLLATAAATLLGLPVAVRPAQGADTVADTAAAPVAQEAPAPAAGTEDSPARHQDRADAAPAPDAAAELADEPAPEQAPEPAPPPTPEQQRHLDAIAALEAEGGAYDAGLAEQLLGLGAAYQAAGRHAEAAETLARAAHITRVNDGLYSPSSLPTLERLVESYAAIGEWDGVGSSYQQMFQIHRRSFGEHDERLLPALQRLSGWHLRAYLDEVGGNPLNHLLTARNLYESSLGILQGAGGADPRLAEALRERAIVDYYLAAYTPPAGESFTVTAGAGSSQENVTSYGLTGFISGREALEQVLEMRRQDPAGSPLSRGAALAELGDWHQLFNRRQTAIELYRQAFGEVAADADPASTSALFGRPVALPVLPPAIDRIASAAPQGAEPASIRVAFAVNERGLAEDIRVLSSEPPAEDHRIDSLRKRLRGTRFRPRFDAGEPVPTPDITYDYRYLP